MPSEKDKESGLSPEISRLSAVLARDPSSKLFMPLAEEYMRAMMVEEAIMTLEDGLKANPYYMSARVLLGKAYVEINKLDDALVQFEQVVKTVPDNLLAHRMLGSIYKSLGRYPDAIRSYRMISILSPKDEEVRIILDELESGKVPPVQTEPVAKAETQLDEHLAGPQHDTGQHPHTIEAPVFDMSEAEPAPAPMADDHAIPESIDTAFLETLEPEAEPGIEPEDAVLEVPFLDMDAAAEVGFEPEPGPADVVSEGPFLQVQQPVDDLGWEDELSPEPVYEEPAVTAGSGYAVDFKAAGGLEEIFSAYDEAPDRDGTPSGNKAGVYEIAEDISSFGVDVFKLEPPAKPVSEHGPGQEEAAPEPFETGTLADLYIAQGFYDRAIGIYKNLLVEEPGNNQIRQKLEDLYQLAGLSSSKAAVDAANEGTPVPAQSPFTGFEEEPAEVWETPTPEMFEEQTRQTVEPPQEAPGMQYQIRDGAVMRLEQFLTNIRKKAGR